MVLYGHNVTKHKNDKLIPSLHLTPEELEHNIHLFRKAGFHFIDTATLNSLAEDKFKSDKAWVHLTFDDGYQDNLDVIVPVLEKLCVPATIFVSSNHIQNKSRFYTYRIKLAVLNTKKGINHKQWKLAEDASEEERLKFYRCVVNDFKLMRSKEALEFIQMIDRLLKPDSWKRLNEYHKSDEVMDVQSLRKLASSEWITIGSHNHDHLIMNANMTKEEIDHQMCTSKKWLMDNLNINVSTYCYPNGQEADFTELSIRVCSKYYKTAFTTLSGFVSSSTNALAIPRMFLLADCISIVHRAAFPNWIFKLKQQLQRS